MTGLNRRRRGRLRPLVFAGVIGGIVYWFLAPQLQATLVRSGELRMDAARDHLYASLTGYETYYDSRAIFVDRNTARQSGTAMAGWADARPDKGDLFGQAQLTRAGTYVAVTDVDFRDNVAQLWRQEPSGGLLSYQLGAGETKPPQRARVTTAISSADGSTAALLWRTTVGQPDAGAFIVDVETFRVRSSLQFSVPEIWVWSGFGALSPDRACSCRLSQDGTQLAVATSGTDGNDLVQVFAAASGKLVRQASAVELGIDPVGRLRVPLDVRFDSTGHNLVLRQLPPAGVSRESGEYETWQLELDSSYTDQAVRTEKTLVWDKAAETIDIHAGPDVVDQVVLAELGLPEFSWLKAKLSDDSASLVMTYLCQQPAKESAIPVGRSVLDSLELDQPGPASPALVVSVFDLKKRTLREVRRATDEISITDIKVDGDRVGLIVRSPPATNAPVAPATGTPVGTTAPAPPIQASIEVWKLPPERAPGFRIAMAIGSSLVILLLSALRRRRAAERQLTAIRTTEGASA